MTWDIFGVPVALDTPRDFDFILNYGEPFAVWAQPEKGLLCFGVEGPRYGRLLIRYAGAPLTGGIPAEEAVGFLRRAMPVYEALYPHPALIKLQGHGPAAGGYMAIFQWPEGLNLRENDVRVQLGRQPLLTQLGMIDRVFDFHLFALQKGYQPLGFDEGGLTADWTAGSITVCDIDLYRTAPAVNDLGRMPGSSFFLSPEEYRLGEPLDGRATQYTMGALAFFFFGDRFLRERVTWTAGEPLYRVACRACEEDREKRYATFADFLAAWRQAAGETWP